MPAQAGIQKDSWPPLGGIPSQSEGMGPRIRAIESSSACPGTPYSLKSQNNPCKSV